MEGYCIKCQAVKDMNNVAEICIPQKGKMIKGNCSDCGMVMYYNPNKNSPQIEIANNIVLP